MGKNKKWKRKAKRLLGNCLSQKCDECEYYNYELVTPFDVDLDFCFTIYRPVFTGKGIRELEKEFRGKNI